jgi:acetyl-CoA C-acetyltransferase
VTSGWPELDGLWDYFTHQSMGALTEIANARHGGVGRAEQDAFAAASHTKAAKAWKDSLFADEVVPVSVPQRRGEPLIVTKDEGIRTDVTAASLAGLRPSFPTDGTITAGSPSQLSDGAAAVAVTSRQNAARLGLTWLAQIGSHASVAGPDCTLQLQPVQAIEKACTRSGMLATDLDLVEINEAFAAVGIVSARELGLDPARVNVNGGAIALGHPLGMSGTRITLHLAFGTRPPRRRHRRRRTVRRRRPG